MEIIKYPQHFNSFWGWNLLHVYIKFHLYHWALIFWNILCKAFAINSLKPYNFINFYLYLIGMSLGEFSLITVFIAAVSIGEILIHFIDIVNLKYYFDTM